MVTLHHHKMHPHTKFEISTSNNMRYAPDTIILKTRSEVKVTMTRKWYVALRCPKMYSHTKFGIPTSNNIGDMHRTQSGTEGLTASVIIICLPKFLLGHKNIFGDNVDTDKSSILMLNSLLHASFESRPLQVYNSL